MKCSRRVFKGQGCGNRRHRTRAGSPGSPAKSCFEDENVMSEDPWCEGFSWLPQTFKRCFSGQGWLQPWGLTAALALARLSRPWPRCTENLGFYLLAASWRSQVSSSLLFLVRQITVCQYYQWLPGRGLKPFRQLLSDTRKTSFFCQGYRTWEWAQL